MQRCTLKLVIQQSIRLCWWLLAKSSTQPLQQFCFGDGG